jgi:hypothetical protein
MELFEKRVKSRFSQKQIMVFAPQKVETVIEILESWLLVQETQETKQWNQDIKALIKSEALKDIVNKCWSLVPDFSMWKRAIVNFTHY